MAKGTIIEKKASLITVETTEGNVYVSLHKHALDFIDLSSKKIGDEVTVSTELSNEGRLYATNSNKNAESWNKGLALGIERRRLMRQAQEGV